MVRPGLLVIPILEGRLPVILNCAHRTSTFLSCAFCEQEGTCPLSLLIFPCLLLLPSRAACLDSHCACRTSTFPACAFHEHRRPTDICIPSPISSLPHTPFSGRDGKVPNRAHRGTTFRSGASASEGDLPFCPHLPSLDCPFHRLL